MMKRTVFLAGMLAALLIFGMVLAGCDNGTTTASGVTEEPRSDPVLGETFTINGKVYGEIFKELPTYSISYTPPLTSVTAVTVTGPFETAPAATTNSGTFTVTIPAADLSQLQTATTSNLASWFNLSTVTLEPADAKFGRLSFSVTPVPDGYDPDLYLGTASASGTENNGSYSETTYQYIYVDNNVTIKGSEKDSDYSTSVDLSLKKGWNVVEELYSYSWTQSEEKTTRTYSVKGVPASAKWFLYESYIPD